MSNSPVPLGYAVPPQKDSRPEWAIDPIGKLMRRFANYREWFDDILQEYADASDVAIIGRINEYFRDKDCPHPEMVQVWFRISNNSVRYAKQCTSCYWATSQIAYTGISQAEPVYLKVEYDGQEFYRRKRKLHDELLAELQKRRKDDFFEWYTAYLKTAKWEWKRQAVLRRDNYTCQAQITCQGERANEVHHLNYSHVGNEPLFDLVSVCHKCHEEITRQDREKSNAKPA